MKNNDYPLVKNAQNNLQFKIKVLPLHYQNERNCPVV